MNLKKNSTINIGDYILLTKPLGVGIFGNLAKMGLLTKDLYDYVLPYIVSPNIFGEILGEVSGVSAMTDVTGFGLIGHLLEMTKKNNIAAVLYEKEIPFFHKIKDFVSFVSSPKSGLKKNYKQFSSYVNGLEKYSESFVDLLFDPQSSGGMLISVDPKYLNVVKSFLKESWVIGRFIEKEESVDFKIYF